MFVSLCRRVVSIFSQGPVFSSQDRPRIGEEVIKQRRNSPTKVLFGFLWPNRLGNSAPIAMKHHAMTKQSSFERAIHNGAGVLAEVSQNSPHDIASEGNPLLASESAEIANTNENGVLLADDCQRLPLSVPRAGLEPA